MARFRLLSSSQELRRMSAESRRECADMVRRCRFELRETRAATEAAITESRLLMREVDVLVYAPPTTDAAMTSNLLHDPQHWRDRAEEMRAFAERIVHVETRRTLETIVADYEVLARRAEERLRGNRRDV